MATTILLRNDITSNWKQYNPILGQGEIGIEFIDGVAAKVKIGDGTTKWNNLAYFSSGEGDTNAELNAIIGLVNSYSDRINKAEDSATTAMELANELSSSFSAHATSSDEAFAAIRQENEDAKTELQTVISGNTSAIQTLETALQTERSRIDTWLTEDTPISPDGAELIDARIGYGGDVYGSVGTHLRTVGKDLADLRDNLTGALGKEIPDGLYYEGNQLYLTAEGEIISDPVTVIGGSGGGGGAAYTVSLKALTDRTLKITTDQQCILKYSYSSVDEDGYPDGNGIGTITVNNRKVSTISVPQGDNELDITPYLSTGTNSIKV